MMKKKLYAFLQEHFQPGPLEQGGQHYLREAFTAYYKARFETNEKRKAEYVLQGSPVSAHGVALYEKFW